MCKVNEIGQTSAFAKRGPLNRKGLKNEERNAAAASETIVRVCVSRFSRENPGNGEMYFITSLLSTENRVRYFISNREETFLANYFSVFSVSFPARLPGSPVGSYKFVCTFARPATIIAIGFAPISVASPT